MKKAKVYMHDQWAGTLIESVDGYEFSYRPEYLRMSVCEPVSLTLPLSDEVYRSTVMFPFFDGLIPEGWLLDIAERNWKINTRDRMSLLLATCLDCIGAVSIHPINE